MKKLIALLMALTLLFALVACGTTEETPTETEAPVETEAPTETEAPAEGSPAQNILADFRNKVGSAASMEELANTLITNEAIPFAGAAMAVEPGFLNGFTAEITGFEECAMFSPMIGSIPFVGYVFRLADSADTAAFIETLKASADLRWNICTEADEMAADAVGNVVCFVMAPATFEE